MAEIHNRTKVDTTAAMLLIPQPARVLAKNRGTHDASVAAARNSKKFFEYGRIIPFLSQASLSTHNLMLSLKSASSEGTQPAWCLRASG